MLLSAEAAKALFAIIMLSTQGMDMLKPELPLHVEDRGGLWLVTGTPYDLKNSHHHMTHMFFRKDTAEVAGIMSHARFVPVGGKEHWSKIMSDEEFERVFGLQDHFEPNGIHPMLFALYGGLINKPNDAVDYAIVLMRAAGKTSPDKTALDAREVDQPENTTAAESRVWHIYLRGADGSEAELLSFSRNTGRLLSGDL